MNLFRPFCISSERPEASAHSLYRHSFYYKSIEISVNFLRPYCIFSEHIFERIFHITPRGDRISLHSRSFVAPLHCLENAHRMFPEQLLHSLETKRSPVHVSMAEDSLHYAGAAWPTSRQQEKSNWNWWQTLVSVWSICPLALAVHWPEEPKMAKLYQ